MIQTYSSANPKEQLNLCRRLFYGIAAGIIIILPISYIVSKFIEETFIEKKDWTILLIIASAIALLCFTIAVLFYNKVTGKVNITQTLNEKMNHYRKALAGYLAICEIPAMISAVCLLFSGNVWLIIIPIVMLLAIWYKRPTREQLTNDLQLTLEEQQQL